MTATTELSRRDRWEAATTIPLVALGLAFITLAFANMTKQVSRRATTR